MKQLACFCLLFICAVAVAARNNGKTSLLLQNSAGPAYNTAWADIYRAIQQCPDDNVITHARTTKLDILPIKDGDSLKPRSKITAGVWYRQVR
jgi:hypothetical protein